VKASTLWVKCKRNMGRLSPLRFLRVFRFLRVLTVPVGLLLASAGGLGVAFSLYGMSLLVTLGLNIPEATYAVQTLLMTPMESLVASSAIAALGLLMLLRSIIRCSIAAFWWTVRLPRALWQSPMKTYRQVARVRDSLIAKVEFLQAESQKFKTCFSILRSPYSLLRAFGLSPQLAATLLFAGSVAGTGVVVNETLLADRSFSAGDAGVYLAPGDSPVSYVTDPGEPGYNTLRIDLNGTTPVRSITIENVSVGTVFTGSALPSGEQNVVQIGGSVISGGTSTRLIVGTLIFEKSRCKKLTLSDIQTHTLIVRGNASDGQSIAPSPGTSRMRAVGGGHHQADSMLHSGGLFDRILIQSPTSGSNGMVDKLTLSNLYTSGGECVLSRITAGTVEILYNEIGQGNGFATKEFVIATNVTAAVITIEDNVEVTISEPSPS
jgi:hypothetical protein